MDGSIGSIDTRRRSFTGILGDSERLGGFRIPEEDPGPRMAKTPGKPLFQLIYVSAGLPGLSEAEVAGILAAARAHNPAREITGLLLCLEDAFLQVLEGPEAEVRALFERIREDPRHSQVLCLVTQAIAEREFPGWSMGYDRLEPSAETGPLFRLTRDALAGALPDGLSETLLTLIRTFQRINAA